MAGFTAHFGLETLNQGESFSLNGQKYTTVDRDTIDRLLYAGAEGHRHTGITLVQNNPGSPLALTLNTSVGGLPAATRVYYVYTWVDPSGFETAPSPEAFVDTAPVISAPIAPSGVASGSGGTLIGSSGYFYALSAFTGSTAAETTVGASVFITTPAGATSSITLTYPALPVGATGFNIYRRAPGEAGFFFLASVPLNVATPPTAYLDNGTVAETCSRLPAAANATNSTNSVAVTVAGAPPTVPAGFTWNLYRTYVSGSYGNSLLAKVVPVLGLQPVTTVDTGAATGAGAPPLSTQLIGSPPKVNMATDTTGVLAAAQGTFPLVLTFSFPGSVFPQTGLYTWTCEFPTAKIVSARATLARGSHPASTPVIVDVLKGSGPTPTYTSIYGTKPQIPVGTQVGAAAVPTTTALVAGDTLSVDITQGGGGASPTDHDLTVNVLLIVSGLGLPSLP